LYQTRGSLVPEPGVNVTAILDLTLPVF